MKKIYFLTAFLFLVFYSQPLSSQDKESFKNKTWGFKIEYPAGWDRISKNLDSGFVFMSGKDIAVNRKVAISIIVMQSASFKDKSLDDITDEKLSELTGEKNDSFKNFKVTRKVVDRTPAIYMAGDIKDKQTGEKVSAIYYMMIKNNIFYMLMGVHEVNDADYDEEYFNNLFENQFKFY